MKRPATLAILVAALVVAAAPGGDEAGKDALKKLEGTWKVLKFTKGGDLEPADEVQKMRVIFAGDKLTVKSPKLTEEATVKLDPSKTPATLDIQPAKKKDPVLAIYKLEKGQLTICFSMDSKQQRPTEFKSTPKDETGLMVLQRVPK